MADQTMVRAERDRLGAMPHDEVVGIVLFSPQEEILECFAFKHLREFYYEGEGSSAKGAYRLKEDWVQMVREDERLWAKAAYLVADRKIREIEADANPVVYFWEGKKGEAITQYRGRYAFPSRGQRVRPGEAYEVVGEKQNSRRTVYFLTLGKRIQGKEVTGYVPLTDRVQSSGGVSFYSTQGLWAKLINPQGAQGHMVEGIFFPPTNLEKARDVQYGHMYIVRVGQKISHEEWEKLAVKE